VADLDDGVRVSWGRGSEPGTLREPGTSSVREDWSYGSEVPTTSDVRGGEHQLAACLVVGGATADRGRDVLGRRRRIRTTPACATGVGLVAGRATPSQHRHAGDSPGGDSWNSRHRAPA